MTGSACSCGCGASLAGWSSAGYALRRGVQRVYRATHGTCYCCGAPLSQYGECEVCD